MIKQKQTNVTLVFGLGGFRQCVTIYSHLVKSNDRTSLAYVSRLLEKFQSNFSVMRQLATLAAQLRCMAESLHFKHALVPGEKREEVFRMFTSIYSGAVCGIDGQIVCVEADISDGFPTYSLVGYLASEVKEARERVTAALKNSGYRVPAKKIIINLSPAGMRKQGTAYDLPIALAILGSLGVIPQKKLQSVFAVGELSLDGSLRPVKGILPLILMAKKKGFSKCIIPAQNVREACLAKRSLEGEPEIIGISDLKSAWNYFSGKGQNADGIFQVKELTGRMTGALHKRGRSLGPKAGKDSCVCWRACFR